MKTSTEFSLIMTFGGMIIVTGSVKLLAHYGGLDYTHVLQNKYYWIGLFAFCLIGSIAAHFMPILYPKFVHKIDEADAIRRNKGQAYYYVDASTGIEEGPIGLSEVRSLIAGGQITPRTLVRKASSSKDSLRPAKSFREITELGRQQSQSQQPAS